MKRLLKDKRGEGFVDVCVLVLAIAMVLALVVRIAPVFVAKQNLDFEVGHSNIKEFEDVLLSFSRMKESLKASLEQQWAGWLCHKRKSSGFAGANRTRPQYLMERHRKNPARQRGGSDPHNHRQYWAVR